MASNEVSYPTQQRHDQSARPWLPFDEYGYRKIIDICKHFMDEYSKLNEDYDNTEKLSNLLTIITEFAKDCNDLPRELREADDVLSRGLVAHNSLHPQHALKYVMKVFNELMRQSKSKGRKSDYLTGKFFDGDNNGRYK